jgi:DNA-binding FadR family transcriptional regulator
MDKSNVSDKVYRMIKEKIINGEWKPGMKIASENQLAEELGVSRMSVREAMEKLVALDVIFKKRGEGTFVSDLNSAIYLNGLIPLVLINPDSLIDILEFRSIIEVGSTKLCAERCTKEDIELLQETYERMKKFKDDADKFYKADFEFHMIIAKGSNNSLIIKINSILTDLLTYHQKEMYKYLGPKGGIEEHIKIIDAIKDRDSELAALLMQRHIHRTLDEIKNIYNNK